MKNYFHLTLVIVGTLAAAVFIAVMALNQIIPSQESHRIEAQDGG